MNGLHPPFEHEVEDLARLLRVTVRAFLALLGGWPVYRSV
jgi:hypothetical protein